MQAFVALALAASLPANLAPHAPPSTVSSFKLLLRLRQLVSSVSEGFPSPLASLPSSFNSPLHDGQVWQGSPLRPSAKSPHFALLRSFGLSDPNEHGSRDVGSPQPRRHGETMLELPSEKFHRTSKRRSVSFGNLKTDVSNFPALELPPEILDSTLFNGDNRDPSLLGQLLPSTGLSNNPTVLGVPAGDNLLSSPGQLVIQEIAANVSDISSSGLLSRELSSPRGLLPSSANEFTAHSSPDGSTGKIAADACDSSPVSRSNQRCKAVTKYRHEIYHPRLSPPEMNMVPPRCIRVTNVKSNMRTCGPTHATIHQPTPTIPFHISLDGEAGDLTNLSLTKDSSFVLSNGFWNDPDKLEPRTNSDNLLAGKHISSWRNSTLRPHLAVDLDHTPSSVWSTIDSQPLETKSMKKVASQKLEANALKKRVRKPRHQCTRPGCGQTFTEKHNLHSTCFALYLLLLSMAHKEIDHLNSHDGLKPHPCKHCNKTFAARSTLSRHSKTCASNIASTT